jgi:mannose-6-phosphate isomerase-like protein (cupin superfamily)
MHRLTLGQPGLLVEDDTLRMELLELSPGNTTSLARHPASDAVFLFTAGAGEIRTADRVHKFKSTMHAFASAGAAYQVANTGNDVLRFVRAMCPGGKTVNVDRHDEKARPGGVTLQSIEQYDRFPDSGLVRGGMYFLEPGKESAYHSHDAAAEVFAFLRSDCDATVEGVTERFVPGEALYVPAEDKHKLANAGDEKLVVWLTVTPNIEPSHTFYEPLPDGTWQRTTPRIDGRPVRAPSR